MRSLSSYYLAVHTGVDYAADDYDAAAGSLANLLTDVLSSRQSLSQITHNTPLLSATSEIEVSLDESSEGRELVGKAVLDMLAPAKVKLDKAKFSKLIKAHAEAERWPQLKIAKRLVPAEGANPRNG